MSEQTKKPEETTSEPKPCFIITPIGEPGKETYTKAMGLIKSVVSPVLKEQGYYALPANEIQSAGSINKQIIQHLVQDELVIANVTGFNPNVMYELAIRHSYKKKVIIMAEKGPNLPFDIFDQRTIFYEDTLHGVDDAVTQLRKMLQEVISSEVTSNPIIDAVKEAAVLNTITAGENGDVLKYIVEKLDRMESSLNQGQPSKSSQAITKNYSEMFLVTLAKTAKLLNDSPDAIQNMLVTFTHGLRGLSFVTLEADHETVEFMIRVKDLESYLKFRELLLNTDQFIFVKERQL